MMQRTFSKTLIWIYIALQLRGCCPKIYYSLALLLKVCWNSQIVIGFQQQSTFKPSRWNKQFDILSNLARRMHVVLCYYIKHPFVLINSSCSQ